MEAERADGNRQKHQRVVVTRWWVMEGRWKLRKPPMSREDSLVVVEGQTEVEGTTNELRGLVGGQIILFCMSMLNYQ